MFRTLLFIPGNNKRFLEKSRLLYPDILCFDLEDSVPISEKSRAREMIIQSLLNNNHSLNRIDINTNNKIDNANHKYKDLPQLFVRINSFESGLYEQDLDSVICEGLDGIVIPKVNSDSELEEITEIIDTIEKKRNLQKTIRLIPSIESSQGVVNSYHIAKYNSRICSLLFGVFDYLYDMKLDYDNEGIEYSYARAKIPVDARAAGIPALDSIWQKVDDLDGLQRDAKTAKKTWLCW